MNVLSTYAAGYGDFYHSSAASNRCGAKGDAFETRVISGEVLTGLQVGDPQNPCQRWWPWSVDFREEAARRAGRSRPVAVSSWKQLVVAIQKQGGRSRLDRVLWFGHGSGAELKFGGGQVLGKDAMDTVGSVAQYFSSDGKLILYACNIGGGQSRSFFQSLANRLGIQVCGFSNGVRWSVSWDARRRIIKRGIAPKPGDPIGGPLPEPDVCAKPKT
ncbi:MAG: hypothetical protein H6Q30_3069 [Bacteroidetes bacterium]|nr:hypothetical protein [Bacteroidota bacterium]